MAIAEIGGLIIFCLICFYKLRIMNLLFLFTIYVEYYYRVSSQNSVGSTISNWQRANTQQGGGSCIQNLFFSCQTTKSVFPTFFQFFKGFGIKIYEAGLFILVFNL